MKNFSKILIAAILGMFLIAGSSSALTITDYITGDGIYVGGVIGVPQDKSGDPTVFVGLYDSTTPTLDELKYPQSHQDSPYNVDLILSEYNQSHPDLPTITTYLKTDLVVGDPLNDVDNGTITLSPGTEYISLKWDGDAGGWFLWNVAGLSSFDFGYPDPLTGDPRKLSHGLSHYTKWNPHCGAPVPEPATLLLLGAGLVGLAGFGRKKIKK